MIRTLDDLVEAARGKGKKRLVVPYAQDAHTIEAVDDAIKAGLVDATLIGDSAVIEGICKEQKIDYKKFNIIPEYSDMKCVETGVRMVSEKKGDFLMKGLVSTDKYVRGILNKEYGLVPPKGILSHVCVMQLPGFDKLIIVADVAIIPNPDFSQKVAMSRYLIETAQTLGIETPKMAFIAPSEQLLPGVSSSTDAALLAKMGERGQLGDVLADGPLALDVALLKDAAAVKKVRGNEVVGNADCLLFANIDAANVFFKCATRLMGSDLAGMVVGTKVPCILTSRADTRATKLYSIALGCISVR